LSYVRTYLVVNSTNWHRRSFVLRLARRTQ
jgi:hypothetical protein